MKKINLLLFSAALIGLTSCLKDGKVNLAPGASPAVIEWATAVVDIAPGTSPAGTASPYSLFSKSFDALPSINQALQIGYTGGGTTSSAITANIATSSTALLAYNVANFGPSTVAANVANYFVELPAALYTLPASVVIDAGTNKATFNIAIKTASFDFTKKYAIALTITSVSGTSAPISGNFGTIVFAVAAKNKYDGTYKVTGTLVDNASATITGNSAGWTCELRTQTATAVAEYDGYYFLNGYDHPISDISSYYGSYSPQFEMNTATDKVTGVTNWYGQPASNGRSGRIDASGINQWTISGTSKKMEVTYWLQGPGFVDRTKFVETWTYTGPR